MPHATGHGRAPASARDTGRPAGACAGVPTQQIENRRENRNLASRTVPPTSRATWHGAHTHHAPDGIRHLLADVKVGNPFLKSLTLQDAPRAAAVAFAHTEEHFTENVLGRAGHIMNRRLFM